MKRIDFDVIAVAINQAYGGVRHEQQDAGIRRAAEAMAELFAECDYHEFDKAAFLHATRIPGNDRS